MDELDKSVVRVFKARIGAGDRTTQRQPSPKNRCARKKNGSADGGHPLGEREKLVAGIATRQSQQGQVGAAIDRSGSGSLDDSEPTAVVPGAGPPGDAPVDVEPPIDQPPPATATEETLPTDGPPATDEPLATDVAPTATVGIGPTAPAPEATATPVPKKSTVEPKPSEELPP